MEPKPQRAELRPPAPVMTDREMLDFVFHEISQPVAAIWCALEVAVNRPPQPEEDRQDLIAAFQMVEGLGKKLRAMQAVASEQAVPVERK